MPTHWIGLASVILFLVATPASTVLFQELSAHDVARVAQLVIAVVCAGAVALRASAADGRTGTEPQIALVAGAIGGVALLAVWHAPDSVAAFRELALFLGIACIVVEVAGEATNARLDVFAVSVVVAALLGAGLVLVVVVAALTHSGRLNPFTVVLGYDNHRFFNHVQTVLLPLLAIATSQSFRHGQFARLAWLALTLHFALLFFTEGRGTGLALLGASAVLLGMFHGAAAAIVRTLALSAGMGAVLYVALFVAAPSMLGDVPVVSRGVAGFANTAERIELWTLALNYATQHPLLGIGPMHYAHQVNPIGASPHNIYLQIASEWGLPLALGLIALSLRAAGRMVSAIKTSVDPSQTEMGVALFGAVAAVAIDGAVSGNFAMPMSQVWIAFAVGWAMAWTRLNRPAMSTAGAAPWRALGAPLSWLALASQLWLWWSIWPEVSDIAAHLDHIRREVSKGATPAPRFWSNGWF